MRSSSRHWEGYKHAWDSFSSRNSPPNRSEFKATWGLAPRFPHAWAHSHLISMSRCSLLSLLPFQGSFCYSWQSPLSPSWWANTLNSNMCSFSSMRDRDLSFPSNLHMEVETYAALEQSLTNTRSQIPAARAFCNALNKQFLLKCLAPTKSIAPIIPSEWICNSLTDWLT